ncbi:MAG: cation:proton antiporter [Pseudomonas sp.]|jgi:multicomponent K+:H+ antiporter subunit E|nr:cation:proton antiporter [Pseudomonas sp.]
MKYLLPAPRFSLALWILWLVLNQSLSPGNLLLGALLGFFAPLFMQRLRPQRARFKNPRAIVRLFLLVGRDVVMSNLEVGWKVWNLRRQPPRSAFVRIPLDLHDANGLAALAMITTVVPGTVWSELALDRKVLLMHVFDMPDEAQFIEHFKSTYERPLLEIFQ